MKTSLTPTHLKDGKSRNKCLRQKNHQEPTHLDGPKGNRSTKPGPALGLIELALPKGPAFRSPRLVSGRVSRPKMLGNPFCHGIP